MAGRVTQVIGEVMYGEPGVATPARVTQVIGEVMFKPVPIVEVWAEQVMVASSTRTTKTVINNPLMY
jgi:hypothetical protein